MAGYISKDFVHTGCGLWLDPDTAWENIPYSVQKNIKKATKEGVTVRQVNGTPEDIDILRSMWYDPSDPNMPRQLSPNDFMFIAEQNGEPIGAMILLPVGTHLFLNNLAGNGKGKLLRVQDFLLWHCVNHFRQSSYKYLDVGVSYRESLYNFFKKWKTFGYPVIFNPPNLKLQISLHPFNNDSYSPKFDEDNSDTLELLKKSIGAEKITFAPSSRQAVSIMNRLGYIPLDGTFTWKSHTKAPYYIDLTKIFPVQFGALIVNIEISDKDMWNIHRALDIFKRQLVFSSIAKPLQELDLIIAIRKRNYSIFESLFEIEDINIQAKNEFIPSAFYFISELHSRYNAKLNEFGIEHYYAEETGEIGLPLHQNLNRSILEYIYAVYRGALNLCSEWVHTDTYDDIK